MNNMVSVEAANLVHCAPNGRSPVFKPLLCGYHRSEWTSEGYQDSFIRFVTMSFYPSKDQLSDTYNHGSQKIWETKRNR